MLMNCDECGGTHDSKNVDEILACWSAHSEDEKHRIAFDMADPSPPDPDAYPDGYDYREEHRPNYQS